MASGQNRALRLNHKFRTALVFGVFAGVATVGACSQVPDAVNPAEWYRKTVDVFAGDDKKPTRDSKKESDLKAERGTAPPGADKPFPKLAQVDQQAKASRDDLSGGLSADPERPKYAPAIPRQGQAADVYKPAAPATAAARPPAPAVAAAPVPPAMPTAPVAQAPGSPPPAATLTEAPTPTPMTAAGMPAAVPDSQAPATAAMPPVTQTVDQKAQESRLTRQLAEIRARAADSGVPLPANAMLPATTGGFDTVVVSSQGIETGGFQMAALPVVVSSRPTADAGGTAMDTRGALPVPRSAIRVATILFDNGSSRMKVDDKRILGAVSRLYQQQGGNVRIVGHASSRTRNLSAVSHKMANFKISVDRANAVAEELVRLGVMRENILIAAVSDAEPMYYEIMPSGEAGNRRTEIYLGN